MAPPPVGGASDQSALHRSGRYLLFRRRPEGDGRPIPTPGGPAAHHPGPPKRCSLFSPRVVGESAGRGRPFPPSREGKGSRVGGGDPIDLPPGAGRRKTAPTMPCASGRGMGSFPFDPGGPPPATAARGSGPAVENRDSDEAWCRRPDSNRHGLPHTALNRARLPIPPLRRDSQLYQAPRAQPSRRAGSRAPREASSRRPRGARHRSRRARSRPLPAPRSRPALRPARPPRWRRRSSPSRASPRT